MWGPVSRVWAALVVAVMAVVMGASVVGCRSSESVPASRQPFVSVKQWNFVWHPNEILDVYSPEGVFVRAFIEGFIRNNDHRGRVDPYPGFIDAVGFPLRKALRDALSLDVSESPARGAQDFAIASRAQVGGEVSVEICASFVRCTYRTPDNTAWLYFGNGSGFFIHRVTYALPSAYPFVSGLVVVTRARPLRTRRLRWTP